MEGNCKSVWGVWHPYTTIAMTIRRAFLHALEWRLIASTIDFIVVYLATGRIVFSLGITGVSNAIRTVVHAFWVKYRAAKKDNS